MSAPGSSLRRPIAAPAALLHAAAWFAVLAHGHSWVGAWTAAVDQVAGSVVIVGPLLAGLVADTYARRTETSIPALVVAGRHPVRGWYAPVARLWVLATANLGLVAAEVLVVVALAGPRVTARPLWVLPVCALVLAGHAGVGMVIGLWLSPRLAGAVAGAMSFGLFLLAVTGLAPASFVIGGATDGLVGERYRVPVLLALGVVALLTIVALTALSGWNRHWPRSRTLAVVVCSGAAMLLSRGAVVDLDTRFEVAPVPLICRGASPRVCVPVDAPRSLAAASRGLHALARPLVSAGVTLPKTWTYDWGQASDVDTGSLVLDSGVVLGSTVPIENLARSLTRPAWCPGFRNGTEPMRSYNARLLLENWIADRNGLRLGSTNVPHSWFASTASEAWVRATYAKLRSCDLAAVSFPSGKP